MSSIKYRVAKHKKYDMYMMVRDKEYVNGLQSSIVWMEINSCEYFSFNSDEIDVMSNLFNADEVAEMFCNDEFDIDEILDIIEAEEDEECPYPNLNCNDCDEREKCCE